MLRFEEGYEIRFKETLGVWFADIHKDGEFLMTSMSSFTDLDALKDYARSVMQFVGVKEIN